MLGTAIGHVKRLLGTAAQKADLFEALAKQIVKQSGGGWNSIRGVGADGSHIFMGRQGEPLVVDPGGKLFRGDLQNGFQFTLTGLQPNYGSLAPLD